MGKSLGVTAFVLLLLSFPIPVVGNFLSVLALLIAAIAAASGERTWAVVVALVGGIKLFFMSPSWMFLMYSHHLAEGTGQYGDAVAAQQKGHQFWLLVFHARHRATPARRRRAQGVSARYPRARHSRDGDA